MEWSCVRDDCYAVNMSDDFDSGATQLIWFNKKIEDKRTDMLIGRYVWIILIVFQEKIKMDWIEEICL